MVPEQSQVRVPLPTSPKGEKVQENKLQFLISASSLLVSKDFFLEESNRARAEAPQPGVRAEGGRNVAQAAPLNKPTTKVGFRASRVQGIPKPPRQCWSISGCSQ